MRGRAGGRFSGGGGGLCPGRLQLVGCVLRRPRRRWLGRCRRAREHFDLVRWHAPRVGQLVGTEFSLSGADISGSGGNCFGITTGTGGFIDANCHTNINWLLTGLVKAGFARDRWMAYGAVGYAVAGVDHSVTITSPIFPGAAVTSSQQDTAYGVAYGAGFDFALSKDFTIGVQYLHANLESRGEGLLLGGLLSNGRRDIDLDTITARFNFKWGGDCCAPVPMK
jgi:outer membrane protein with beta-barrel domain